MNGLYVEWWYELLWFVCGIGAVILSTKLLRLYQSAKKAKQIVLNCLRLVGMMYYNALAISGQKYNLLKQDPANTEDKINEMIAMESYGLVLWQNQIIELLKQDWPKYFDGQICPFDTFGQAMNYLKIYLEQNGVKFQLVGPDTIKDQTQVTDTKETSETKNE